MLKYQITGEMIRAKMDDLLGTEYWKEDWFRAYDEVGVSKRKELYEAAFSLLKEEMAKQKAEDEAKEL